MIEREAQHRCRPDDERAVFHNRALLNPADPENERLRRVQHRRKRIDAVPAQVRDGSRPAGGITRGEQHRLTL